MNSFISALIEAWGEIKINRGRVILSLVGVGVAVWAMATVLAMGGMITSADTYFRTLMGDRPGMITLSADPAVPNEDMMQMGAYPGGPMDPGGQEEAKQVELVKGPDGRLTDQFGSGALETVNDLQVTHWTRTTNSTPEIHTATWTSKCSQDHPDCWEYQTTLNAVDPAYYDIYALRLIQGRWINDADAMLQMNPVVVSKKLWDYMGNPSPEGYPQILATGKPGLTMTLVGVVDDTSQWANNQIYMHYDGFVASNPVFTGEGSGGMGYRSLQILVPLDQQQQANDVAVATLQARVGDGYNVSSYYSSDDADANLAQQRVITAVISAIGGIVILLGAFGLLTVSIVTVRQRIREIGIRRAMGASARRIFFSVFLESVVATTAAGFVGVIASILTIRFAPLEKMEFPLPADMIPYPMSAALLGVLIAAFVGALAGIIPATIALRVKPIDAIRF